MWALKIPVKTDRMRGGGSQETDWGEHQKIMAKMRSLGGGKKDEGAGLT